MNDTFESSTFRSKEKTQTISVKLKFLAMLLDLLDPNSGAGRFSVKLDDFMKSQHISQRRLRQSAWKLTGSISGINPDGIDSVARNVQRFLKNLNLLSQNNVTLSDHMGQNVTWF